MMGVVAQWLWGARRLLLAFWGWIVIIFTLTNRHFICILLWWFTVVDDIYGCIRKARLSHHSSRHGSKSICLHSPHMNTNQLLWSCLGLDWSWWGGYHSESREEEVVRIELNKQWGPKTQLAKEQQEDWVLYICGEFVAWDNGLTVDQYMSRSWEHVEACLRNVRGWSLLLIWHWRLQLQRHIHSNRDRCMYVHATFSPASLSWNSYRM